MVWTSPLISATCSKLHQSFDLGQPVSPQFVYGDKEQLSDCGRAQACNCWRKIVDEAAGQSAVSDSGLIGSVGCGPFLLCPVIDLFHKGWQPSHLTENGHPSTSLRGTVGLLGWPIESKSWALDRSHRACEQGAVTVFYWRKRERARAGIEPTAAAPSQPDCPGVSRSDHSAGYHSTGWVVWATNTWAVGLARRCRRRFNPRSRSFSLSSMSKFSSLSSTTVFYEVTCHGNTCNANVDPVFMLLEVERGF